MLSLMNAGSDQTVEFYAASSSNRQAIGDLTTVFTQPKERSKITYTTDGRRFLDGKVDERASQQIEPGKTWDLLMINELAKKQMKVDDSEIQRKASMKKSKTSLRKFLPNFATRRNKAPKSDASVKGKAKKQQK